MGILTGILSGGGGGGTVGATEYASLGALPAPASGAKAIVGGILLVGNGAAWVYEVAPAPMSASAASAPGNVANALTFVANDLDPDDNLGSPTSTSAWTNP